MFMHRRRSVPFQTKSVKLYAMDLVPNPSPFPLLDLLIIRPFPESFSSRNQQITNLEKISVNNFLLVCELNWRRQKSAEHQSI